MLQSALHCARPVFYGLPIARALTAEAAEAQVDALISCCWDYSNSLLYGVSDYLTRKVQSMHHAAARIVTASRRRDHITPMLHQLRSNVESSSRQSWTWFQF